jgi:hypothetical protein
MSSTDGGDELDESGVEELGDEDHDREDEDSGEEFNEAAAGTSSTRAWTSSWDDDGDGDEGGAGWGGRPRTRVRMLLGAALPSRPVAMGLGADPTTVCASEPRMCWRWSNWSEALGVVAIGPAQRARARLLGRPIVGRVTAGGPCRSAGVMDELIADFGSSSTAVSTEVLFTSKSHL